MSRFREVLAERTGALAMAAFDNGKVDQVLPQARVFKHPFQDSLLLLPRQYAEGRPEYFGGCVCVCHSPHSKSTYYADYTAILHRPATDQARDASILDPTSCQSRRGYLTDWRTWLNASGSLSFSFLKSWVAASAVRPRLASLISSILAL